MSPKATPLLVSSKEGLETVLSRPDTVPKNKWGDVVEDVFLALEESYRLFGYEGVLVLDETSGGYRAFTGLVTSHEDVETEDLDLNIVGANEDEIRIPNLPLVTDVYQLRSLSKNSGSYPILSGVGQVGASKIGGINVVDDEEILLSIDPMSDFNPPHKIDFHIITDENKWQLHRFDESDNFEIDPSLFDRVFIDEYPARSTICVYINRGDLVHISIPENHHKQVTESLQESGKRYETPTNSEDDVAYHPCRVIRTESNSVSVKLLGTDDDIRHFTGVELRDIITGNILPAPRSEQSFNGNRHHDD